MFLVSKCIVSNVEPAILMKNFYVYMFFMYIFCRDSIAGSRLSTIQVFCFSLWWMKLAIVQIEYTPRKELIFEKKITLQCISYFHTSMKWYFKQFGKGILYRKHIFTVTGHMTGLLVGIGSLGHDGAGATKVPVASHNSCKVEQVILRVWIHSSSVKSHNTPMLRLNSECSCCSRNKPANI